MMKMNKRICKRLILVGMALSLVLAGCGDTDAPKSTETAITALVLTIGTVDETITFGADGTASVTFTADASIPGTATVKSVTLSKGASGLKNNDVVDINAADGVAKIKITAEDGTTTKDYTVTVIIGDKLNLSSVTLSYSISPIKAVENFPNAIGSEPAWDTGNTGAPTPEGITYSIDASTTSGPTTDGTEGTPVVVIDPNTGKITITADAVAANSGAYTVTATAGADSNYLNDAPQTVDVTVEITATKPSLDTTAFTYAEVETTAGTANDIGVEPAWDGGTPPPVGITYDISGGSGSGTTVVIDTNNGKITITADAEAANSGEYTVTATASATSNYEANSSKAATVTVTIAKRDLSTATFSYAAVDTTEGTAIAAGAGAGPVWTPATGAPAPNGITYSVTGYSGDGEQDTGVGIDVDGKITITAAAAAANSGTYTVTATAGSTSNYADTTTQTTTVTVTIAKRDLSATSTVSFSYASVTATEGTANTNGVTPTWNNTGNDPVPVGITYSLTDYFGSGTDGRGNGVEINTADGTITITAQALVASNGDYEVTATAGPSSNYKDGTTKTTTFTVTIAKRNLNTATFSYTVKKALGAPYADFFMPVWTPTTGAPTPNGITYSITVATSGSVPTTDGTVGGTPVVDIDQNTGKITITAAAVEANSGDYTVKATAGSTSNYANTTTQTTTATVNVIVFSVGDDGPAGGKVFHDEGDYTNGWRYLEAAPSDHGSVVEWGGDGDINGGTQTGIGSGMANTANIVATLVDNKGANYAAKICAELDEGGKDDWFLPSKDELNELYEQRVAAGVDSSFYKSFSSSHYWSSSEHDSNSAWIQDFGSGSQIVGNRDLDFRVRAVRAF